MLHEIGLVVILLGLVFYVYLEIKKTRDEKKEGSEYSRELDNLLKQRILLENRKKVIATVHEFLKEAKFIKPLAIKGGEKIYQYVYAEGFLYEFKEILAGNNRRVGKDSENLCFRDLSYLRVNNPTEFIEKFSDELTKTESGNPNMEDRGLGLTSEEKEEVKEVIEKQNKEQITVTA